MAEADLYAQLSAVAALGGRVYPLVLPQNITYPAVSYQRISAPRISTFNGDLDLVKATIQVELVRAEGQRLCGV